MNNPANNPASNPAAPGPERQPVRRRGLMLVLSSPSGAGKSTISRRLLHSDPNIDLSISATTRPCRPGEVAGRDYDFIDRDSFERRRQAGDMLESAEIYGNLYGTPRAPVETALAAGRDVLFDIEWQGTRQLRDSMGDDTVSIFILPPSVAELRRRLIERGRDDSGEIARRLAKASEELGHWRDYTYVLINRQLDRSVDAVRGILAAERLRRSRQPGLADYVEALRADGL